MVFKHVKQAYFIFRPPFVLWGFTKCRNIRMMVVTAPLTADIHVAR